MSHLGREWMYERRDGRGHIRSEFMEGVSNFINTCLTNPNVKWNGNSLKCPCKQCKNINYKSVEEVRNHLLAKGFMPSYFIWYNHGDSYPRYGSDASTVGMSSGGVQVEPRDRYVDMVFDAAGPSFQSRIFADGQAEMGGQDPEEEPNVEDQKFFKMLKASDKELWGGCEKMSQLSAVARLLNMKSEHHLSEKCFDSFCQWAKDALPNDNSMVDNFYQTKKLIEGLGLPFEKIDCCERGCMLYWGEDELIKFCKVCESPRYKTLRGSKVARKYMFYFPLTHRLKRLYMSEKTASSMRWHSAHHHTDDNDMCHPCDSEAWKHFNAVHPEFAVEGRNIRLGLCTDGFQPFGQSGAQYSCWPVIVCPYNLPPDMCMKEEYMFLSVLVPGPCSPKQRIDVYLQPLIKELKMLWEIGVQTYDVSKRQNFQMRAALMWTIGDLPATAMMSGWGTAGKTACPVCMEQTEALRLVNGSKQSWFDAHRRFLPLGHPYRLNKTKFRAGHVERRGPPQIRTGEDVLREIEEWGLVKVTDEGADEVNGEVCKHCGWRKRSIFWDLPYWKFNMVRHNLDVMHIEKNVFENIFNTVMDIEGKTKDNAKAREDMSILCRRKELERHPTTGKYPKAAYALTKEQKQVFLRWINQVKFPDGYMSNVSRCVDMRKLRMFGMKSHDCHVFMQRLIPIGFRELLPKPIWEAITELSNFFKSLTAKVISKSDMKRLEAEIPVILCKLEMIFPPAFFDSMEHMPVHLPYEARVAGPVQYRWMYPFER